MASKSPVLAPDPASTSSPLRASSPYPTAVVTEEDRLQLKRRREPDSTSPRSSASQHGLLSTSPVKTARLALASRLPSPPPLTGAAALEEESRLQSLKGPPPISENPSHTALAALMSSGEQGQSQAADAPEAAPLATMDSTATKGLVNSQRIDETGPSASPNLDGAQVTESPAPMDVDMKNDQSTSQQVAGQEDRGQPVSLSYPGSLQSNSTSLDAPTRAMSFPSPPDGQGSPSASSAKKHKCPYCNTEFTRHHNLKSHLLTHSQEKPFLCTECQMRFRRLHDLKRHGKLHTGEKPHICPKCDRKFARGDALARHSKGAGGCAGRRSSMGSFVDGEDMDASGMGDPDDSAMSGLTYENPEDEELRRQSLPSIHAPQLPAGQGDGYAGHSRTYPPAGPRPSSGGLYPPNVANNQTASSASTNVANGVGNGHSTNTSISSVPVSGNNGGTEARPRSPSLSQSLQQQQPYARRQSELQSPHGARSGPKLPGLSHPGYAASSSTNYSHGRTQSGSQLPSNDSGNMFAQSDPSVWVYIQTLEEKIKQLSDKVVSLEQEVVGLKVKLEVREDNPPSPPAA